MNFNISLQLKPKRYLLILIGIIVIGIALRLHTFAGYVGLDDAEYARLANQVVNGDLDLKSYNGPKVFPLRFGIILPTAFSFLIFGINEWSMVL